VTQTCQRCWELIALEYLSAVAFTHLLLRVALANSGPLARLALRTPGSGGRQRASAAWAAVSHRVRCPLPGAISSAMTSSNELGYYYPCEPLPLDPATEFETATRWPPAVPTDLVKAGGLTHGDRPFILPPRASRPGRTPGCLRTQRCVSRRTA
jgi:hypothetical protein